MEQGASSNPLESGLLKYLLAYLAFPLDDRVAGLTTLSDEGFSDLTVAMNLSPAQLKRLIVAALKADIVRLHCTVQDYDPSYPSMCLSRPGPWLVLEMTPTGWVAARDFDQRGTAATSESAREDRR